MEILELEQKYSELKSDLNGQHSKRTKLIKISEYLRITLSFPNTSLIEPYIIEFIPDFLKTMIDLEIRGLNPNVLQSLKEQTDKLKSLNLTEIDLAEIEKADESLKNKIVLMNGWLNNQSQSIKNSKVYFPLLERIDNDFGVGYLESISIVIKNGEQKFHISPADLENDEQLEMQVHLCFTKAIEYCKQFIKKIKPTHTVYLHFENRLGILSGKSLGAALTLSFIESILKHYNSPVVVTINNCIAITGGIDNSSQIISTSKDIIAAKIETVFFSDVQIFCVPKEDEYWAEEKLSDLKKRCPGRNLKIIGLTDLEDLLSRRNIVDIKKQKLAVRTGKFVKKNWISAAATVLLAIFFAFLFVMDFDDNPAIIATDGTIVFIKNKNEKILWSQKYTLTVEIINAPRLLNNQILIVDINNDGQNEVLFCLVSPDNAFENVEYGSIVCYNYKKKLLWKYAFKDTVLSKRETIPPPYNIEMIDTLTVSGQKQLLIFANSVLSFASAILRLDLQTGMRVGDTFWSSGNTANAFLKDINNDGNNDLIQWGHDNGYNDVILCCLSTNSIRGYRPTTNEYQVLGQPSTNLLRYIRFPKNDYELLASRRMALLDKGSLHEIKAGNDIVFTINVYEDPFKEKQHIGGVFYKINYNLKDIDVFIHDPFRVARDSLVTHGVLKPPYTDTKEYIDILKSKILYYKDGKWVNREELH